MNRNPSACASLASLGALFLVVGCTSGEGTIGDIAFSPPREPPPNERAATGPTRDDPANTREDPGNDRQDPGSDRDHAGPGAPSGSGRVGSCPACDAEYDCIGAGNGQAGVATLSLVTKNGRCVLSALGVYFNCDGTYVATSDGSLSGTWTPYGSGGFAISRGDFFVQCVPGSEFATSSSGSSSSSGASSN